MLTVFSLCGIRLPSPLRVVFAGISAAVFLSVQTIGRNPFTSIGMPNCRKSGIIWSFVKDYGFMHSVFYVMIFVYFAISIGVIVYSLLRKNQVSRKILVLPSCCRMWYGRSASSSAAGFFRY